MEQDLSYDVFRHLTVEQSARYRALLRVFVDARARFTLHLRPTDLWNGLAPFERLQYNFADESALIGPLQQLVGWGNLTEHADHSEVKTVEDFLRPRHLYQFTPAGEAAEHALDFYRDHLERPGELQTSALSEIRECLHSFQNELAREPFDSVILHRLGHDIFDRLESLTTRAQQFMGGIRRTIDFKPDQPETFLRYKDVLLGYIKRFIGELMSQGAAIADVLAGLPQDRLTAALAAAAEEDLRDALEPSAEQAAVAQRSWLQRWQGLVFWFIGDNGPSQAERLRASARAAIPDLLNVIKSLNDRRLAKSDRAADYLTLARWFADAPTADDAHILWRAAFCLSPARHLTVTRETLDINPDHLCQPKRSYLEAEPMWIAPRLRETGHIQPRGRAPSVVDHSAHKLAMRAEREEETRRLERARESLQNAAGPRLSEFSRLDPYAFRLLLDCLTDIFNHIPVTGKSVTAFSTDGTVRVIWTPIPDAPPARIETEDGTLEGPDGWISIESTVAAKKKSETMNHGRETDGNAPAPAIAKGAL